MDDVGKAGSGQKRVWPPPGIVLLLVALPVGFFLTLPWTLSLHAYFVPAYSASVKLEELRATVRVQFHWTNDPDGGRYLTVYGPVRSVRASMCDYDWAHHGRTELYWTERRTIAVIGNECDYEISLEPLGIDNRTATSSVRSGQAVKFRSRLWTYLGAFDFVEGPGKRTFVFTSGGQPQNER